jgi:hypothetical protein
LDCRPDATIYVINKNQKSGATLEIDGSTATGLSSALDGDWFVALVTFEAAFTGNITVGAKNNNVEWLTSDIAQIAIF